MEPIIKLIEARKLPIGHENIDFGEVIGSFLIHTRGVSMMNTEILDLTIQAVTACETATAIRLSKFLL